MIVFPSFTDHWQRRLSDGCCNPRAWAVGLKFACLRQLWEPRTTLEADSVAFTIRQYAKAPTALPGRAKQWGWPHWLSVHLTIGQMLTSVTKSGGGLQHERMRQPTRS